MFPYEDFQTQRKESSTEKGPDVNIRLDVLRKSRSVTSVFPWDTILSPYKGALVLKLDTLEKTEILKDGIAKTYLTLS